MPTVYIPCLKIQTWGTHSLWGGSDLGHLSRGIGRRPLTKQAAPEDGLRLRMLRSHEQLRKRCMKLSICSVGGTTKRMETNALSAASPNVAFSSSTE